MALTMNFRRLRVPSELSPTVKVRPESAWPVMNFDNAGFSSPEPGFAFLNGKSLDKEV